MPGEQGPFEILYHPLVVERDIPALPKRMRTRIKKAIELRLATRPLHYGKPLRYSFKGHRRLRVGEWRIVYRIERKTRKVIILIICHRKDVYSALEPRLKPR
ncbi:MAG: type II toxin-antitoxin system RelE/ParE family toxin [Deltaproteobacteria bacterium]|nr:MAG: type II toxin-antitoxin system RelE/ParE family toxin [Deltaproteobacteria bacterium]